MQKAVQTVVQSLVLMSGLCAAPALWAAPAASSQAAELSALRGTPVQLDARRLATLQPGERLTIRFPLVGDQTMVFEGRTPGLRGEVYWHGSLAGQAQGRLFIRQTATGFVAGLRLGKRVYAFQQPTSAQALRTATLALPSTQGWRLADTAQRGVHAVQGGLTPLAQAETGSEVALPLPNGQTEVVVVTRHELDEDGVLQLQGVSRMDGTGAPTVLSIGTEGVFGVVYSQGREYQIVTRHGQTQLIDPQGVGWQPPRGDDHVAAATHNEPSSAAGATASAATVASVPTPLAAGTVDTTITLLMTYSQTYVSQWGTEALARLRLSNLVQVANAAYANSGTGIAFKITGWGLVRQADTTPQVVLPALRAGSGSFNGVPALKSGSGAAMTVFFAPFNTVTSKTNTCGLAYVPASSAQGLAAYKAQAGTLMYAALNDGQSGNYYCESLTLAHELGHNLGNAHDKANSSYPGVFSYSYGKGTNGVFGTVMSYISPRVALFSSPQLKCTASGVACGSATENVVATLLQTKATVAALGNKAKVSTGTDGYTAAAGWLLNANGTPYTGVATLKASNAAVTCAQGTTGLYVCKVPSNVNSVSLTVTATGKTVAPSVGSFSVNALANTPVNATRFYLSAAK
ncbi:MAG: hypothetical protein RI907_2971 [Pseudomonadota bacterium]|jgi:hypothetical protein